MKILFKRYLMGFLLIALLSIIISCKGEVAKQDCSKTPVEYGWHHDAIFYHLWIKSFADSASDENQIGDFKGIIEKLDYLKDLGITALWLSPMMESGLKSEDPKVNMHAYDTTDYYKINSIFGTNADAKRLLKEAHKRGIKVTLDFVLNHSSSEHPWFKDAISGGKKKDWYMLNKRPNTKFQPAWGGGGWKAVWHQAPGTDTFYYSVFRVPSLADFNFRNPEVQDEMQKVAKFWLDMGFDGLRCDAVRYLYENAPDGVKDQPETFEYFKKLRKFLDDTYKGEKIMYAEAWGVRGEIGEYFGNGNDQFHMCFDFDFASAAGRVIKGVQPKGLHTLLDYELNNYPCGYRSATFLSNHDNHTSRPYTYFQENAKQAIQAAALNILSFGTPFIYYGNEIGMSGRKGSDMDLRALFNWKDARKQAKDKNSMLSWYKYLTKTRHKYKSMRRGDFKFVKSSSNDLIAYVRSYDGETTLVLLNTSDKPKTATLDFTGSGAPKLPVSVILGEHKGDKSLEKNYTKFTVKDMGAQDVTVLYIGKEKQKRIFGASKKINGGMSPVPIKFIASKTMFVRGSMNKWSGDTPMKKIGKTKWSVSIELDPIKHEFKFEVGGKNTWLTNWGDNEKDGIGDIDGKNITINMKKKGKVKITFDEKTAKYQIK